MEFGGVLGVPRILYRSANMKKLIGILGLSMAFASSALAAPAEGTAAVSLDGTVTISPDAGVIDISAGYLTFISDGIAVGGGVNIGMGGDDPLTGEANEMSLGLELSASYWGDINDDMGYFAGLNLALPVTPAFQVGAGLSVGAVYWLGENFGATLGMDVGLGENILGDEAEGGGVDVTADLGLGIVSFF